MNLSKKKKVLIGHFKNQIHMYLKIIQNKKKIKKQL